MKDCLIALDIGGTFLKACLFEYEGDLIPDSFDSEPVDSDGTLNDVKDAYKRLLVRLKNDAESRDHRVSAVAADTPGPFDFVAATSLMRHKYKSLYGVPQRPWFREILGDVPVCFLHDSSAFLYGAAAVHPEIPNAAGVMIGTGLGFAVMKDGRILQNETGGPAYSIFMRPYQGQTAEDFVSGRGILNRYNDRAKDPVESAKEVSIRASMGDPDAQRVLEETGEILADVIRPILSETGVEALYLGGQVSKSFSYFEEALRKGLQDVGTLRIIEKAKDLDLVHMTGLWEWFSKEHPERTLLKPYPMKLKAVLKDIIWGGTRLGREYHKPSGKIAEAWALSVHPEGISGISNGAYAGSLLSDYLGSREDFPIMIKLIDAADRLSIQVHPVKTEMWYIMDCEPGAKLVYGLKEKFSEKDFREALSNGTVEDLLNYVPVHPGDVFFIPTGLIHAIGAGILIAEIQQNSNVTYRVYDYGRLQNGKPRTLHVDEAMRTIRDFTEEEINAARYALGKGDAHTIANCPLFRVERHEIRGELTLPENVPFTSVVCLNGEGRIGKEKIEKGDSFYLPKGIGEIRIAGELEVLITTV